MKTAAPASYRHMPDGMADHAHAGVCGDACVLRCARPSVRTCAWITFKDVPT